MKLTDFMNDDELTKEIKDDEHMLDVVGIKDEDEADETLAKILWAKNKLAENNERIAKKKKALEEALKDYENRLNHSLNEYVEYHSRLLKDYLEDKLKGKTGTMKLFHGNIRLKKPAESLAVDDEPQVVTWLKDHGYEDFVAIKESVKKSDVKKAFKKDPSGKYYVDEDGMPIHGMHVETKTEGLQLAITPSKTAVKADDETKVA